MYPCHRPQQSHYKKHKSANTYVPLPPPTAVTLHKTQIRNPLCTFATAHSSHITQNTDRQTLIYHCHRPHNSHYSKKKSEIPYVSLPPSTPVTLHKTQTANPYITLPPTTTVTLHKKEVRKTLMYLCQRPHHSHYTKHKSANTYVPLSPTTKFTLHKTQIRKLLCTLQTAHSSHITQNTDQQSRMYLRNRPQQSNYTKHRSANTYEHLLPPTPVTLHKKQIRKPLCTLATAEKSHITQNTIQQTLMFPCHRPKQSHYTKHKSTNPYVTLPPPTPITLHITQISKHLCTLANANSIHIT